MITITKLNITKMSLILLTLAITMVLTSCSKTPIAKFETNQGNFEVELNPELAPITVENFIAYVNEGYYDGLVFHRIISTFMIQGGGFSPDLVQKETKEPIKNEADNGLKNLKYTIAMARTGVVDSATSQFFINTVDNGFLDFTAKTDKGYGYAVFGKVISGFETVDKIKDIPTTIKYQHQTYPQEDVIITKVTMK
jgi:peptidyl-prolyl cis-trans isomerase B (cyclophilin B)